MNYHIKIEDTIQELKDEVCKNPFNFWTEEDIRFWFKKELEKKIGKCVRRKIKISPEFTGIGYETYKNGQECEIDLIHSEITAYYKRLCKGKEKKIGQVDIIIVNKNNKDLSINPSNCQGRTGRGESYRQYLCRN